MIAFAYYVALGVILVFSHGMQNDGQTLGLVALQLVFSALALFRPGARPFTALGLGAREGVLGAALVLFSLFLAHGHEMLYARQSEELVLLFDLLRWLPVLGAVLLGASALEEGRARTIAFWAAAAAALGILVYARVLVIVTSPSPRIDVWTSSQRAVEYFLDGKNPYTQSYQDIYAGRYDYFPSFPYLPAYLYWATLGFLVFKKAHDVRASLLVAELITAGCIAGFARKQGHKPTALALVVLVWLAFPVDLFILEQGWIDALLLAGFAAAAWALVEERLILSGIFLGIACSTKQYAVLGVSFWLLYAWRVHGVRGVVRLGGAMCLTALAFMGPFAALNFKQFTKYTLMSWGGALPRVDSLSLPAYLAHKSRPPNDEALRAFYVPFQLASYATWGALLVWLGRKKRPTLVETLGATAAVTGVLLVIAKQSFCNYYYFLSFFVLLVALVAPGETEPAASSSSKSSSTSTSAPPDDAREPATATDDAIEAPAPATPSDAAEAT